MPTWTRANRFAASLLSLSLSLAACSDDVSSSAKDEDAGTKTSGARLYASVAGEHEVLVIDEASHEILSEIPVGEGPAILLATPDEKKLYTANWADNTVSSIVIATEEVTSIEMSGRPYVIATSPDGISVPSRACRPRT